MSTEKTISTGILLATFIYLLIFPAVLLWLSGDWLWPEGWIFSIWFMAMCISTILYLYHKDPSLLAERYRKPGTGMQKGWDKYVVAGLLVGFITWIVIMPLDAKRYGWTPASPLWLKALGGIGLLFSFYFFFRSYAENTFVSPLVRIQTERKHLVISTGVYGIVRHPMYLAATFLFIGAPVMLGSLFGEIIGLALILLLMGRIIGEEKMLTEELEGYAEYKNEVKYRLIPYVW